MLRHGIRIFRIARERSKEICSFIKTRYKNIIPHGSRDYKSSHREKGGRLRMRILIWGTGKLVASYMKFEYFDGHEIIGFVDTYKAINSYMGYKVFRPQEIANISFDLLIIGIAQSNVEILETCIKEKLALNKVFFVRFFNGFGELQKYADSLMNVETLNNIIPLLYVEIKEKMASELYMRSNFHKYELKDSSMIKTIGGTHIIAWFPVELLFSERTEDNIMDSYPSAWLRQNKIWEDHPIESFEPYKNLFEFFLRGNEFPTEYCEWWRGLFTSRGMACIFSDEQLIEKRFREFIIMQQRLNEGMEFFISHPAIAKWNNKGYFNLLDGHHRASFLYHSGLRKIPVRITKHDYDCWCNYGVAREVIELIKKQERFEFYQPILNPYFLSLNTYRENYNKSRLHHILEYLGSKRVSGMSVLDIGACLGYFGQAFARMGANVTMIENDPIHYELLEKINNLLYIKCKTVFKPFEEFETNKQFDVAIMLTVFYPYMGNNDIRNVFLSKLNRYVKRALIWESGDEIEKEKTLIMQETKFKNFQHLSYEYATGKFRELGIFFAEGGKD